MDSDPLAPPEVGLSNKGRNSWNQAAARGTFVEAAIEADTLVGCVQGRVNRPQGSCQKPNSWPSQPMLFAISKLATFHLEAQ
jgi:hypothetical protein